MPKCPQMMSDLPEYESPPVAEVVCGVAFSSLVKMPVAEFGQLWELYKGQYPTCREMAPLPPVQLESLQPGETGFAQIPLEGFLIPRSWFIATDGNSLIQVQRDRFLHNWRKTVTEDVYPRYSSIVAEFEDRYQIFRDFVAKRQLGEITHQQYELTYVNHILGDELWQDPRELGAIIPDFTWRRGEDRLLGNPVSVNWVTMFDLPEGIGRLSIVAKNGTIRETGVPVLLLELSVKGLGKLVRQDQMKEWFGIAHEWIVRGFADITAMDVQKQIWGRTR